MSILCVKLIDGVSITTNLASGGQRQPLAKMSILRLRSGQALGGELELLPKNSAELEKPDQRFLDQVVRAGSAGGDANDSRTIRKPEVRNDFSFFVQIVMLDFV